MNSHPFRFLPLFIAALLLGACSTTILSGSWKNPDYRGQIHKTYIVGVGKSETTRRMFEDQFVEELQLYGVSGVSSYKDLPDPNASKESISGLVIKRGADSLLMAKVTGKRTEEVVTPGRISGYNSGPRYGYSSRYSPDPYHRNWGNYYDRRFEATYEPARVSEYEVATIEANLYDAKSGELIWSAQLETVADGRMEKLINDFVKTVTRDMRDQGLL